MPALAMFPGAQRNDDLENLASRESAFNQAINNSCREAVFDQTHDLLLGTSFRAEPVLKIMIQCLGCCRRHLYSWVHDATKRSASCTNLRGSRRDGWGRVRPRF